MTGSGDPPIRILILPRYGRKGASSRLRTSQYIPALTSVGIDTENEPFFDDDYLARLYAGKSTWLNVLRGFAKRISVLSSAGRHDLIWVEKEALPWVPWWLEKALLPRNVPIVSDHDDAIFHRYDMHRFALVRKVLGNKIDRVMANSSVVMVGNEYLGARARSAGAANVEIVPTVIDAEAYWPAPANTRVDEPRVGWIGTPVTWRQFMAPMLPMLAEVASAYSARFHVVGAGPAAAPHPLIDNLRWSEATEVARIQEMQIGLMPLEDTPWSRGKCGYKLVQYMGCGLPVIASPVGVNSKIVEHGVNGFLAASEGEWREALITLLADPDLRARMGAAGRKRVEEVYSLQGWVGRVTAILRHAAEDRKQEYR